MPAVSPPFHSINGESPVRGSRKIGGSMIDGPRVLRLRSPPVVRRCYFHRLRAKWADNLKSMVIARNEFVLSVQYLILDYNFDRVG
jgi:hypothetical protein